jgi:hypothetical protein
MINEEVLKFFLSLGVGGVLAGFMFWFYRRDIHENRELIKRLLTVSDERNLKLMDMLEKATAAIAANNTFLSGKQ